MMVFYFCDDEVAPSIFYFRSSFKAELLELVDGLMKLLDLFVGLEELLAVVAVAGLISGIFTIYSWLLIDFCRY